MGPELSSTLEPVLELTALGLHRATTQRTLCDLCVLLRQRFLPLPDLLPCPLYPPRPERSRRDPTSVSSVVKFFRRWPRAHARLGSGVTRTPGPPCGQLTMPLAAPGSPSQQPSRQNSFFSPPPAALRGRSGSAPASRHTSTISASSGALRVQGEDVPLPAFGVARGPDELSGRRDGPGMHGSDISACFPAALSDNAPMILQPQRAADKRCSPGGRAQAISYLKLLPLRAIG